MTRCIVRLEWHDGQHWVFKALDAPWHVHQSGVDSSQLWADMICERCVIEWTIDELKTEFEKARAA